MFDLLDTGYRVYTIDHNTHSLRVDLEHSFGAGRPEPLLANKQCFLLDHGGEGQLQAMTRDNDGDEEDADGPLMRVADACSVASSSAHKKSDTKWISTGVSELHVQHDAIVEYDPTVLAPIGLVHNKLGGRIPRLVDADGRLIGDDSDGARAAFLEIVNDEGGIEEAIPRNAEGFFYRIFQPNKWMRRQQQQQQQQQQRQRYEETPAATVAASRTAVAGSPMKGAS